MPGKRTSGSTTCESVGQNSGLSFHSVPASSEHALLRISQSLPFDLTVVEHFGHRVCIFYPSGGLSPAVDTNGGAAYRAGQPWRLRPGVGRVSSLRNAAYTRLTTSSGEGSQGSSGRSGAGSIFVNLFERGGDRSRSIPRRMSDGT
jgi:hypothetical protein